MYKVIRHTVFCPFPYKKGKVERLAMQSISLNSLRLGGG